MADAKSSKSMDIAKPGKTVPDTTTRPIITGHKTIKDPMMKAEPAMSEPSETAEEKATPAIESKKKVIVPLSHNEEATPESPVEEKAKPTESQTETEETNDTAEAAVVDAVVDQFATKQVDTIDEAEVQKIQEIEKHIKEKTFFVPISTDRQKKASRVIFGFLLFLIITSVIVLLAADAGLITVIDAPFDIL